MGLVRPSRRPIRNGSGIVGMHGTYEANHAMHDCDVMVCLGARFDDRVTGRIDAFAPHAKKIHLDIDAAQINKNVRVDLGIVADAAKLALKEMLHFWKTQKRKACDQARARRMVGADRKMACEEFARVQEFRQDHQAAICD